MSANIGRERGCEKWLAGESGKIERKNLKEKELDRTVNQVKENKGIRRGGGAKVAKRLGEKVA
jgi:hypothetical protein